MLEQALRDRFVSFYAGKVPIRGRDGMREQFIATTFDEIAEGFRPGGSPGRQWRLELTNQEVVVMPLTLGPLLKWARAEGLLNGQRNKRVQLVVYPDEGHSIQKPEHRRDIARRLVRWFDTHLQ